MPLSPKMGDFIEKRDSEESRFFSGVRRARTSDLYDVKARILYNTNELASDFVCHFVQYERTSEAMSLYCRGGHTG